MAHYSSTLELHRPVTEVFAFLSVPRNLAELAPADLPLDLVSAPETLSLGARLTWKGRRWGITQHLIYEVTAFEADRRITIEQAQGPLALWIHRHEFEKTEAGVIVHDHVEFEPPRGLLGRLISASSLQTDLERLFAYRRERLRAIFG